MINEAGETLIKVFEGLKLNSYKDPVGIWTIGYGHTKYAKPNMKITPAVADQFLREDLAEAEEAVRVHVKVPLTENQRAALVSFVFNLGVGNFSRSTLLRMLNLGKYQEAADQFLRWNRAGGKVLSGLTRRREMERKLFLTKGD